MTPYLNESQITSGTLSYAVALGKPVVSTPYWHARELLSGGKGILVPFNDPAAIGAAVTNLLGNPQLLDETRRRAYAAGREMIGRRLPAATPRSSRASPWDQTAAGGMAQSA